MSIITKSLTAAAFLAAVAMTADAAPVKRVQRPDEPTYDVAGKVTAAEPEMETWSDIGEGILRDDVLTFIYVYPNVEFSVKVQESDQHPGRYRIRNAYEKHPLLPQILPSGVSYDKEHYMIINACDPEHVYIEPSWMGCYTGYVTRTDDPKHRDDEGYQEGAIWSMAGDYNLENVNQFTPEEYEKIVGKLRDGAITFPPGTVLFQPWEPCMVNDNGEPYFVYMWNTTNASGMFRLKLPDAPDVDVKIELLGQTPDEEGVEYELTLQEDIAKIRVALIQGDDVASAVEKIKAGDIDYTEITASGRYTFPYFKDGLYTLVCVPYTEDGVARYESFLSRTYDFYEGEWKKMGTATHTEGILCDSEMRAYGFELSRDTYEVRIEENVKTPGLYRLVNAYGPPYINANEQNYDFTKNYYIEIDGTDPSRVSLRMTDDCIGLEIGSYGPLRVWSKADRLKVNEGMTNEEIDEWELDNGPVWGWVDSNNTIKFPRNSLLLNFAFIRPETWYWANRQGEFAIKLPNTIDAVATIDTDVDAPVEYYTIDGMKVNGAELAPGLYVVRQGARSWKQMVK